MLDPELVSEFIVYLMALGCIYIRWGVNSCVYIFGITGMLALLSKDAAAMSKATVIILGLIAIHETWKNPVITIVATFIAVGIIFLGITIKKRKESSVS